jgi:hypothetical protein
MSFIKPLALLILLPLLSRGQERFEGDFYVTTIYADTLTVDYRRVIIAYDAKTAEVCLSTEILRCFTELTPEPTNEAFLGIMKSVLGDRYLMRIVYDDRGMTFWFTNLDGQYPHIVITTRDPR